MKKYSLLVLSLLLVFLMIGCQKTPNDTPDTQKQPTDTSDTTSSDTPDTSTTTTPTPPVDTTTYERVVIPVNTISQYYFMQSDTEIKVDGYSISLLVPTGPRFDISKTRFLEGTDCLLEIYEAFPFDEYILLSYYKDHRMTVDDKPTIVAYYEHNYQVEVGHTKTGYPYVYYYKEMPATADQAGGTNGALFVKVSDRYVMCTTWFNPDTLQQAHTMIDSIEYSEPSSQPDTQKQPNGDNEVHITLKVYLKEKEGESTKYNAAIKVYNEFLNEKIKAKDKRTGEMVGANEAWNPFTGKPGIIEFALFDVNKDGIPELLTSASTHRVFSYQNDQLWHWYETDGSVMNGPTYILENGALFSQKTSTGYSYTYITFDSEGAVSEVWFHDPGEDYEGAIYLFNYENVSKEEYQQLTKEYMELSQKKATVEWYVYNNPQIIPETYKQILDNKKTFILDGEKISINEYKFPYMMNYFSDCKGVEYAAIDMDGDGKVELLIQEPLGDILILHEENGVVYGYDFIFRYMYHIKDDGSFSWNANSGNTYGVSKLRFENQTCQETEVYRVEFDEDNNSFKYFIYGTEVSEEDFESNSANLESNVELTWYKLDSYSKTTDN